MPKPAPSVLYPFAWPSDRVRPITRNFHPAGRRLRIVGLHNIPGMPVADLLA